MKLNSVIIGKRIQSMRKQRRISQTQLSNRIDKNTSYISYIENGVKCMSLETFIDIANALQTSADVLLIDHLDYITRPASRELTALLSDCTDYEVYVILDAMRSLKEILREHDPKLGRSHGSHFTPDR